MKKVLALVLVAVMLFAFTACGSEEKTSSSISVCLASEPATLDPALNSAVDGATLLAHLFAGLAKWEEVDGNLTITADAAEALTEGTVGADGKVTYTYTLRAGMKWSNGDEVKASDFTNAWQRAATNPEADYAYMFEVVDGYADGKLNIAADDDNRTITVVLANAVSYWNELLAFPTYFPVHPSCLTNENWATDPATYICNGPYKMDSWTHDSVIVLKKNDDFYNASKVTMGEIKFYLSDDSNNMLANFKKGDWLLIDDVPTNEIATLKTEYPTEFVVAGQIGTYYVCWNINADLLPNSTFNSAEEKEAAQAEIRKALQLVIDRNYIVNDIAQGGQVPASSFVAMGMTDSDGSEFYKNANKDAGNSYVGYYDVSSDSFKAQYDSAVATLAKYYTESNPAPSFEYLYNTSEGHKAIGEYIQQAFKAVGITMNLTNQEWNTFLETRKNGDYTIARNGWLADYNDPICFLDMWTTSSGNNDVQFGKGAHASLKMYDLDLTAYGYDTKVTDGTWAETYDVLISTIKSCTDNTKRYAMMHIAEDMLMDTGCITPLYFYTDLYMIDDSVKGFFSNPLGYKYFMYCTIEG